MGLAKTVAPSFKNLPGRLSRPAALFSTKSLRSFNTVSSDTKLKGLWIEARVFRDFHNSFGLQMFSVDFVLENSIFFCLISFSVLYFVSI